MSNQPDLVLSEFTELVAQLVSDFVPHRECPRFRVPQHPTPLDPICDHVGIDCGNDPQSISRNLFLLEWDSGPGYSSFWNLHALKLPSGERVYWVDDADGRRIVAVGPGGVGADKRFARVLFKSNGEAFGTGVLDSAPSRVSTCLRGDVLVDLFLNAFHCSPNSWEAIEGLWRSAVRDWLKDTLTGEGKELKRPERLAETQAQRKFLTLVEDLVSDFPRHPTATEFRVAPRFTPTAPLAKFAGGSRRQLPHNISRGLIQFCWWNHIPGSTTTWEVNVFDLRDGTSVYWIETEFGDEEPGNERHIIGTGSPSSSDEQFIALLFRSNGKDFGVDVLGAPPLEIASNLKDRTFLIEVFSTLFDIADLWDYVLYQMNGERLDPNVPDQRRALVEKYLKAVCR